MFNFYAIVKRAAYSIRQFWLLILVIGWSLSLQSYAFRHVREITADNWRLGAEWITRKVFIPTQPKESEKVVSGKSKKNTKPIKRQYSPGSNAPTSTEPDCATISTLPCDQVVVNLPFTLNFDKDA